MDFKIRDKVYKIINNQIDKNTIYEIKEIIEENEGNWHDGYSTTWIAILNNENGEEERHVIKHNVWGSYHSKSTIVKI
jgi:hypothetical protein